MDYALCPPLRVPGGSEIAGGRMETYLAGTSTPLATYADGAGTANPTTIPLDTSGRPDGAVYLATTDANGNAVAYKFIVKDAAGQTVYTQDEVRAGGLQLFDLPGAVNLNDYATMQLALDAIGADQRTLVVSTAVAVAANTTVPENVSLLFLAEGRLNPSSGVTLTINGPVNAPLWQTFGGAGIVLMPGFLGLRTEWWGAAWDGTTDDTAAINACHDAGGVGAHVLWPPAKAAVSDSVRLYSHSTYEGCGIATEIAQTADVPTLVSAAYQSALGIAPSGHMRLRHVLVTGDVANGANHGIVLHDYYSELTDVRVQTCGGRGIYLHHKKDDGTVAGGTLVENRIENCKVSSCAGIPFYLGDSSNTKLTDGFFVNNVASTTATSDNAVYVGAAAGWVFDRLHTYGVQPVGHTFVGENFLHTFIDHFYLESVGGTNFRALNLSNIQKNLTIGSVTIKSNETVPSTAVLVARSGAVSTTEVNIGSISVENANTGALTALSVASSGMTVNVGNITERNTGGGTITRYAVTAGSTVTGPVAAGVKADAGDAAFAYDINSERTILYVTNVSAARAVSLSTTGIRNGAKVKVVRTLACGGIFSINVGTGPLKALATAGEWCEVEFNGSAWVLTGYGTL